MKNFDRDKKTDACGAGVKGRLALSWVLRESSPGKMENKQSLKGGGWTRSQGGYRFRQKEWQADVSVRE